MTEPLIQVGIMSEPRIDFVLLKPYLIHGVEAIGQHTVTYCDRRILWMGREYDELLFVPENANEGVFELLDVTIGVKFHWERKEDQRFQGQLKIIIENDCLTAINILPVEAYLTSVISSEMSATASLPLLMAHAVISRSWLLSQIHKTKETTATNNKYTTSHQTEDEWIRWYDHDDHLHFDVCADDHCQRYQGITRASTDAARQAVRETHGQVLMYDGQICDARYSKCCGGIYEEYATCWDDQFFPYLSKWRCSQISYDMHELDNDENEAEKWIRSNPEALCNTHNKRILGQVLNNYDQETTDFFRWTVAYTQSELAELIREKLEIDFGDILDLEPVARGTSGRLYKLRIVGSKRSLVVGKELEIRRVLSKSHLYSSAFVVDKVDIQDGVPGRFILHGAGWGHGVGLCQIGAAVMGDYGFRYQTILEHYYAGVKIERLY